MKPWKKIFNEDLNPFKELEEALKREYQYGFIKWIATQSGYQIEKVVPYMRGKKGVRGGDYGPMTSTDTYDRKNKNIENGVIEKIESLGGKVTDRNSMGFTFHFGDNSKKQYYAYWRSIPAYSGRDDYQTYWLIITKK